MTAPNAQTTHCYCHERQVNSALNDTLKDVPEGYCGLCEVCGEPGHTHAHPSAPVTGSWCAKHEPTGSTQVTWVINLLIAFFMVAIAAYMLWQVVF